MNSRIDTDSEEFKNLLTAWIHALKVMDTRLNAYYAAVGALENPKFRDAATYFKEAVARSEKNPALANEMNHKYDSALRKLGEILQQEHWPEALAAWLREYQIEKPEQTQELP
jgi:hypothetical protein